MQLINGKRAPTETAEKISGFFGRYKWLSNMYGLHIPIHVLNIDFRCVETAFVAHKTTDPLMRLKMSLLKSPHEAKQLGRKVELRPDWEDIKLDIMYELVFTKFRQSGYLCTKLLATGDKQLIEANDWGDEFWGVDAFSGVGENHLGRILMRVRDELRGN
jgi:ribA/ribD-fused uncharacterized protein